MRVPIHCELCRSPLYANEPGWYRQVLGLAVRPNSRSLKKGWVCRKCLKKHSKLSDSDFLNLFDNAKPQKS